MLDEVSGFTESKKVNGVEVDVRAECATATVRLNADPHHIDWSSDAPFNSQSWRAGILISRSTAAKMAGVSEDFLYGFEQGLLKAARHLNQVRQFKEKYARITKPSIIRDIHKGLAALEEFIKRMSAEPVSDRLIGEKKPIPAKIPAAIADLADIQRFDSFCCVYFLCKCKRVVYVGQTDNIFSRVRCHKNDKDFDEVFYVCVPFDYLLATEKHFIKKLDPPLNRAETSRCKTGRKKKGGAQ